MNPNNVSSEEWEDCPKGTLQSLAKRSRHRRSLKHAALIAGLSLVALLAWGGWLPSPFTSTSGTLACDQVVVLLPAYASGSLSATQRTQVEQHLKKCPFCSERLRAIQTTQTVSALTQSSVGVAKGLLRTLNGRTRLCRARLSSKLDRTVIEGLHQSRENSQG